LLTKLQLVKPSKLPALSESSFLRYITFSILYVAQGIPYGLLWYAIPAWLAMNDKTPGEIGGYIAVLGIPWSFKIINAPFMDRFTYLAMGRRRLWILTGQTGLIISLLFMATISNPLDNLLWLMILGFTNNFFTVIQDIAVDGMAVDILPSDQQARANGVMWGSKVVGKSLTVVAGSWLLNAYGFSFTMIFFSSIVMMIIFIPMLLRERPGEKLLPWTPGKESDTAATLQLHSFKSIFKSLFKFFFLPASFIMGVAAFNASIGEGLIDALLPIFTVQEIGWTDEQYSQIFAIANLIAGVAGMFIGGALTDLLGKIRMMSIYIIGLMLVVGTFSYLTNLWLYEEFVVGFIISFYILLTFNTIAIFASAMKLCSKRIAATQFTLYMAITNLGYAIGAGIIGPMKELFNWEYVIMAYIPFVLIMLIMIRFIDFDKHQRRLNELEARLADS
jgi:PAT family beta-lactamase induction signal transducer AmpG